jgi:hypothetical protein
VEPVPAGEPILNPLTEEARQKQQEAAEARSSAAEGDPQEGPADEDGDPGNGS